MTTAVPNFGIEKPTAAKLNLLPDVFTEAHTLLGDVSTNLPALQAYGDGVSWRLIHVYRYLHFGSTGTVMDPHGVYPDTTISESDTGQGVLDLDTVAWLAYGQQYRVDAVSWCMESPDA